jgi:hypothetical protein
VWSAMLFWRAVAASPAALEPRVSGALSVVASGSLLRVVSHVPRRGVSCILRRTRRCPAHLLHVVHRRLGHGHLRGHHLRLLLVAHLLRAGGIHLLLVHGLVLHLHMLWGVARVLREVSELLRLPRCTRHLHLHLHGHLQRRLTDELHWSTRRDIHSLQVEEGLAHQLLRAEPRTVTGGIAAILDDVAVWSLHIPVKHVERGADVKLGNSVNKRRYLLLSRLRLKHVRLLVHRDHLLVRGLLLLHLTKHWRAWLLLLVHGLVLHHHLLLRRAPHLRRPLDLVLHALGTRRIDRVLLRRACLGRRGNGVAVLVHIGHRLLLPLLRRHGRWCAVAVAERTVHVPHHGAAHLLMHWHAHGRRAALVVGRRHLLLVAPSAKATPVEPRIPAVRAFPGVSVLASAVGTVPEPAGAG